MTKRPDIEEWIDGPEIMIAIIETYSGATNDWTFLVGRDGVTRIERTFKSGMHSHIPYVRIWKGDKPHAEFCQHYIVGVEFMS